MRCSLRRCFSRPELAGDRFGRRKIFAIGTGLFALASVWCGLAQSAFELIAARALQGIGGALLVPSSLAIISASFDGAERGKAIGTWSGATAITAAIGPVLGGWLIDEVSWRAVFFLNIPFAAVILAITFWHVPESRNEAEEGPLDWLGALLATLGLGGLVYGLIEAPQRGWTSPTILVSLAVGVMLLIAFVLVEERTREPMLPLKLFRSRTFTGANILTFLLYGALGGGLFFIPLNLIQVRDTRRPPPVRRYCPSFFSSSSCRAGRAASSPFMGSARHSWWGRR